MEKALLTLILVLCSAISFCEDLTWVPNSNWGVDSNWELGRQPCAGDRVRFQESSRPSIVYLNSPVTVRSLQLSKNSRLTLGSKAVIRLSNTAQCDARSTVIAKAGENVFVGVRDNVWECPENWKTADNKVPETAPCGVDRAIFPNDSAFYFVTFNSSKELSVAAVQLRGQMVTDLNNFSREFSSLRLTIRPECLSSGDLCGCPEVPKTCQVAPPNTGGLEGGSPGGIAAGVVIVVIVIIVIVIIAVIAVVWWMRSSRSASFHPYHKETLDEPAVTFSKDEEAAVNFDNPMFDSTSDFDELVGAEQLPEPTDTAGGGGDGYEDVGDDLPEKVPL